jgi:glutathione S-transferase
MTLRIWGRPNSINVQKVVWTCEELGVPYDRTDAGGAFGIVGTPEYKAMNPNGVVPVIDDDGFILWESNAITRYLAAKHGAGTLWPSDLRVRADADRWMDWQCTEYSPRMRLAFWNLIRTPKEKQDAAAIEESRAGSEAMTAILDAALTGRRFVAGDRFTMGDIPVGVAVHRWLGMPMAREPRPALEAWYARVMARPAAGRVLVSPIS